VPAVLTHNAYGKSQVRLTKVSRHADRHDLKELSIAIQLEGDFVASYTSGDNSRIVATDTMKNTVYALAKKHPFSAIEELGELLARHFLESYGHVSAVTVDLMEQPWQRMVVDGKEHPSCFIRRGDEKRTATVMLTRKEKHVESGLDNLLILNTTDSAFSGFIHDPYTTLRGADDRIFATVLSANWLYSAPPADWDQAHGQIRQAMLQVFAGHKSLSVQHTLHAMGSAALDACSAIEAITLRMPNKHHLLVNPQLFGMQNNNEIFVPTDEPYGLIVGTLRRG